MDFARSLIGKELIKQVNLNSKCQESIENVDSNF